MSYKYNVDPSVSYLSELLKKIQSGIVKIPRFQRTLVWDWSQQRELLCSIYEGLPIGAILVWNTNKPVNTYTKIGPFSVKPNDEGKPYTYLMDGLQRLSTLYGMALHPVEDCINETLIKEYKVFCDLSTLVVDDIFVLEHEIPSNFFLSKPYQYMPLRNVFDSKELLRFQRSIPESEGGFVDASDRLVSAFKEYKIPVIPFETDDQALVTKSFERINTRGTDMSETHMLNALSYSGDFDLLKTLDNLRDEHLSDIPLWEGIDIQFVLLVVKVRLGLDPYEKDTDKLADKLKADPTSIVDVFRAIKSLAIFSADHLGITDYKIFPYKLQMLAIAQLALMEELEEYKETITAWFWISSYTEAFGTTARNSQNALMDFKNLVTNGYLDWSLKAPPSIRSLIDHNKVNFRQARTKIWAMSLASKKETTQEGNIRILNENKGDSIFSPRIFSEFDKRPGFCFFMSPKDRPTFCPTNIPSNEYDCNFLTLALMDLLESGDYKRFASEREELMFHWEVIDKIMPSATKIRCMPKFEDILAEEEL